MPDVTRLNLSGSDPAFLRPFVKEAHKHVGRRQRFLTSLKHVLACQSTRINWRMDGFPILVVKRWVGWE